MDHVEETLTDASRDAKYSTAVQVACGLAKKTLDKYYSLTDESATYRIAMGEFKLAANLHGIAHIPHS